MGIEYQNAAELIVIRTSKICSGPYATEDKASEERIAKAFVLLIFCSPNSVDLSGLPINTRFKMDNIVSLAPLLVNTTCCLNMWL
ncbi:hypothetical protein D3C71_1940840 [compost metagenome]